MLSVLNFLIKFNTEGSIYIFMCGAINDFLKATVLNDLALVNTLSMALLGLFFTPVNAVVFKMFH